MHRIVAIVLLVAVSASGADSIGQAFDQLKAFEHGQSRQALVRIESYVGRTTADGQRRAEVARRLATVLADPKATHAAKAFVCRQLLLVGTDEQIPMLEAMLGDYKSADMARRTLEGIPGDASLKALRTALGRVAGQTLVGVVNSLGARRDRESVGALAKLLTAGDPAVAAAAAEALGKIGTREAAEALAVGGVPKGRLWVVHDAQLNCAERLAAAGQTADAVTAYERIWSSDRPGTWRTSALAGLAKIDGKKALPLVLKAIASDEPKVQASAIRLSHSLTGQDATQALAQHLTKLTPAAQTLLIPALAERGDRAAAPAVAKLVEGKETTVRLAAINALATLGDSSTVGLLVRLAATEKGSLQGAARGALTQITGAGIDEALMASASEGDANVRVEAIRALGVRLSKGATSMLLQAATDPADDVRSAALTALARAGDPACYPKLVGLLAAAPTRAGEKAVISVGARLEDGTARVRHLISALPTGSPAAKAALLRTLGACGGTEALQALRPHLKDGDGDIRTAAVRALASWPDLSASGDLLKLAQASDSTIHRVLALRGYLRLAQTAEDEQRLRMLGQIRPIAKTTEAKKMLLASLGNLADAGALHVATSFLADADVQAEAALATLKIGKAAIRDDREAVRLAMEKLLAASKDEAVVKQARALHEQSLKSPPSAAELAQALRSDKKRSAAQKQELAKRAPKGYHLAGYLDCGPDLADGGKKGPMIRALTGSPYVWAGGQGAADQLRFMTIVFTGQQVVFEASGLNPKKDYQLGFSWWDYDHNTRAQSVWASAGKRSRFTELLERTKLPSGRSEPPGEKTVPLPRVLTVKGATRIAFRNEGKPNCVVSEVWLWESDADTEAALPPPRKKGGTSVVIVTGIDYPGHKWQQTAPVLADLLLEDPRLDVEVVEDPDFVGSPDLHKHKVCVLHMMNWNTPDPPPEALENFREYVHNGGGLVLVHFACGAFQEWPEFVKIAGRVWNPKMRGHDPRGRFRVEIADADHPTAKGMKPFETEDELYTCLDGDTPIHVVAHSKSKVDGKLYPMAFVLTYGKGRVFHCPLGHDVRAFEGPAVGELFRRGTAWAAGMEAVRGNE